MHYSSILINYLYVNYLLFILYVLIIYSHTFYLLDLTVLHEATE